MMREFSVFLLFLEGLGEVFMLTHIPIIGLILLLVFLVILSGFFACSETGLMAINRYRLRHLARKGHKAALRVQKMLARPDRILGTILIGNTFANILASAVATVIAIHFWGNAGVAISAVLLTFIILIFSEITPKTLAALHSLELSMIVSAPLWLFLKILYPFVWLGNAVASLLLSVFRIKVGKLQISDALNVEELRTVLSETGKLIPVEHRNMLLSILELEKITVEDVMLPRNEIIGIDLEHEWEQILETVQTADCMVLPVYQGNINNVLGIISLRTMIELLTDKRLNKETLQQEMDEPYFVPNSTLLNKQLLNFRQNKQQMALVVDEYGELQGSITLEAILEEIVGEFVVDVETFSDEILAQPDGSFLVDGSVTLREFNKMTHWHLPVQGPKTLNGLLVEQLETIPYPGTSIKIADHPIEILQVKDNMIKTARIFPAIKKQSN